jgi:hypothetical protein
VTAVDFALGEIHNRSHRAAEHTLCKEQTFERRTPGRTLTRSVRQNRTDRVIEWPVSVLNLPVAYDIVRSARRMRG